MFSFNSDKYDFWDIYACIIKFYPVGISKSNERFYSSYLGLEELKSVIQENILNADNYNLRWKKFNELLHLKIGLNTFGTTYGQAPSFSAYIEIERSDFGSLKRVKKIHFNISLLGPYYSIIGEDISEITFGEEKIYRSNFYVVSPLNEYLEYFKTLSSEIEKWFVNYRFIPYWVLIQSLEGLEVSYTDNSDNRIFRALFNNNLDFDLWTFGDSHYGNEAWLKSHL